MSVIFIGFGVLFMVVGSIGVLRFPDVYTRLHASSKCGTTGLMSIFVGLMIMQGFSHISLKIAVIAFYVFLTTPVAAHAIAKSAFDGKTGMWAKRNGRTGSKPAKGSQEND